MTGPTLSPLLTPVLPRSIALAGPTASGKTAAAFAIAHHLAPRRPVEIISVDSALVYRGMDIGTAKPTRAELASVPHHLIDIRDPLQAYSAADFVHDAERLMAEITARGHLPLLVGGTMLYFKALFEGLDAMPKADAATRAALEAEAAQLGWPAMHAQLAMVDPVTAARLEPADAQRIQRALEVYRVSGQPLSDFHTARDTAAEAERTRNVTLISLEPDERAWLHARIAQRFDAMLADGLINEVRHLRARGDLNPELPSMRCVGYRQAWTLLDEADVPTAAQKAVFRDQGIFATRQLAKRQLTWLRSMPRRHLVAADAPDALSQVLGLVDAALEST
ncbi:tRNA (adenosine(37)-N6)-dimethylallyltransferase MiaA [Rhodoferax koreense]|uniref:tRNA dimethylallyltransferase n=1 Tax=Rhodoferax koreensis TaxID=1842727 RepID=A0A1P8JUX5_9BURK|nr:tRNA (adenosine(37)-N6)-dimethylallyltransferase MiaA [Rhodoferax koreense]APW37545.1 tRNA (adenosine(37)-N6)-dimethylallyltransferase MiaA [Rhodoferax koreense]